MADKSNVVFIDLDEVAPIQVVLRLGPEGNKTEYPMVPLSVLDFVRNMQAIQKLEGADLEEEVRIVNEMLQRSFPTLPMELIERLPLEKVQKLQNAIREATMKAQAMADGQSPDANPPLAASAVSTSDISSAA